MAEDQHDKPPSRMNPDALSNYGGNGSKNEHPQPTRRRFLKLAGGVVATGALGAVGAGLKYNSDQHAEQEAASTAESRVDIDNFVDLVESSIDLKTNPDFKNYLNNLSAAGVIIDKNDMKDIDKNHPSGRIAHSTSYNLKLDPKLPIDDQNFMGQGFIEVGLETGQPLTKDLNLFVNPDGRLVDMTRAEGGDGRNMLDNIVPKLFPDIPKDQWALVQTNLPQFKEYVEYETPIGPNQNPEEIVRKRIQITPTGSLSIYIQYPE